VTDVVGHGQARTRVGAGRTRSPLALALIGLVRMYRVVPLRAVGRCRFHPTCSAYALEALTRHGAVRGTWLAARRLGRCHPWNPGGVDYVP